MKKSFLLLLAASLGLAACNNFEKAPAGAMYKIHKSEDKPKIVVGDFVKLDLVQTMDEDSLMFSSYDNEQPVVFQVPQEQYKGDMYDMLTKFGEGDSATFKLNIDSMALYTKQPKPATMKGKYIVFKLKIQKVLHKNNGEVDSLFTKRAADFFKADYDATMTRLKNAEAAKIKAYVEENKLKTTTTASGLQYVLHNAGTGPKPELGDTVMSTYTGKMTRKKSDGKESIFDTTDQALAKSANKWNAMAVYGPRPLVMGGLVPGMAEGLALMGKGGKATLIIPSSIGFGEAGVRELIPSYAPIVFEVEVVDIKKPSTLAVPPPPVEPAKK